MNGKPKVYVAGVGMITPVGFDTVSTAAAVKAGMNAYNETCIINKDGKPMKLALVPDKALPPLLNELKNENPHTRVSRLLRLAAPAIKEAVSNMPGIEPLALFLAVPESLPECPSSISLEFFDQLMRQTGVDIDISVSRILATGRSGGLQAIDLAFKYLSATGKNLALVGGVDTCLDYMLLGTLDSQDRILSENIEDGFVPGEAAGFLLLISEHFANNLPPKSRTKLYIPGISYELGHRYSEAPYYGDGLSEAFKSAIEKSEGQEIKSIYTSLNGENFGAKEYGVALIRNKPAFSKNVQTQHPADCFGDIGAAFGPVSIGLIGLNEQGANLSYCSSEQEPRAAVVVETS